MKKAEKQKNILDLKHQKVINYLNITIILLVSSFATYLITNFEELEVRIIFILCLGIFLIIFLIINFVEEKLKKIKEDIMKLR